MIRVSLLACLALSAAAAAPKMPNVAYFRQHNMDRSRKLSGVLTGSASAATSVVLNEWDQVLNNFDTTEGDVMVQRFDVVGAPNASVSLFSAAAPLRMPGAMYIIHNGTQLTIHESAGASYNASWSDAVVWISKGSCVHATLQLGADGVTSLMVITSGVFTWAGDTSGAKCETAQVRVGADTSRPYTSNKFNDVIYDLTVNNSCPHGLIHNHTGYSNVDEPIRPLPKHYHTRGTVYYSQKGWAKFNDDAAPNDTIYVGELRWVNAGVYYGPEEMGAHGVSWITSLHETDPASISVKGEDATLECPFACMNEIPAEGASRCVRPSVVQHKTSFFV